MNEEEIRNLGTEDLYQAFSLEAGENNEVINKIYPNVRFGINIKFDIYDYFNGSISYKSKSRKVTILSKTYDMSELYTEIERRTVLMRKALLEIYGKSGFPYKARGIQLDL